MMHEYHLSEIREQPMVISPSIWKLLLNMLVAIIFVPGAIDILTSKYGTIHPSTDFATSLSNVSILLSMLLSIFLLFYAGLALVLCVCRLLGLLPTLIVDGESIRKAPSLFSRGTIRINWEEIGAISFRRTPFKTSFAAPFTWLRPSAGLFIAIVPQYEDGVLARQNRVNKVFFQRSQGAVPAGIFIPSLFLPLSGKKFLARLQNRYRPQIERYAIRIEEDM